MSKLLEHTHSIVAGLEDKVGGLIVMVDESRRGWMAGGWRFDWFGHAWRGLRECHSFIHPHCRKSADLGRDFRAPPLTARWCHGKASPRGHAQAAPTQTRSESACAQLPPNRIARWSRADFAQCVQTVYGIGLSVAWWASKGLWQLVLTLWPVRREVVVVPAAGGRVRGAMARRLNV